MLFEGETAQTLREVDDLMRTLSTYTDPQQLVTEYRNRIRRIMGNDATVSMSRRNLEKPWYRITRSHLWPDLNPWENQSKLPLHNTGILGELLYADKPQIIDDLKVSPDDPAYEHLKDFRSAFAIPQYDNGVATNMVLSLRKVPMAFKPEHAPVTLWLSNLFGRATHALVMAKQLREANDRITEELRTVAEIQRSLLPAVLPDIPNLRLAAHYQTSQQAGGDYYDLFPVDGGKLGMLIADVSGHGTPAAVLMAITHTLAHSYPGSPTSASDVLRHLNERLVESYSRTPGGFVTAFYGVFDPESRVLTYSSAGHNPPRLRREANILALEGGRDLPLGVASEARYHDAAVTLNTDDTLLLYTDGITEARAGHGPLFGERRLDDALRSAPADPDWTIQHIVAAVEEFTGRSPATDDRTLVAARIG
jgi:sigma-B regulation protein RsbU (phosphoserine phosphatase)